MTHAQAEACAAEWIDPLLAQLDAIPTPTRTTCAACDSAKCGHPDPVFAGVIPHSEGPSK